MNPIMLVERTLGWLPRWDLDRLAQQGAGGKKAAAKAVNYLRHTTEVHAVEVLRAIAACDPTAPLLFGETEIQSAYGTTRPNADCVVVWPEAIVIAEVSSRTVTRETAAASSVTTFLKDSNLGVVEKAKQLHSTLEHLREDEERLTGQPLAKGQRRFWPVLVTTEGFPLTRDIAERIRTMLSAKKLLQGDDVASLVIVDIEGLEAAESVAQRTGMNLPSLLAAHESSVWSDDGFREWLLATYQNVRPAGRIMDRWSRILEPALAALTDAEN